jgi:hypothetical protein
MDNRNIRFNYFTKCDQKKNGLLEIDYGNAKKENKAAALVTRGSSDVFTLRVAGIAPDEDVISSYANSY